MAGLGTWRLVSSPPPAALAIIELRGASKAAFDDILRALDLPIDPHCVALRDLLGVDEGLVTRWSEVEAHLTLHGGAAVVRAVCERLSQFGLVQGSSAPVDVDEADPASIERASRLVLAEARSPLAVDLLLDQPRRWRHRHAGSGVHPHPEVLARLIRPPLIVALGPPNVGKSTLVNALAGRTVSITGDTPGVTRDHVGVSLDLGGLVVRYVDAPGIGHSSSRGDDLDAMSQAMGLELATRADLVLLCGDGASPPPPSPLEPARTRTVALRADLSKGPESAQAWTSDVEVSVRGGWGLQDLVRSLREALVPADVLSDARPWRFWDGFGARSGATPV